jgi:serine/threonine-protein kinase
VYFAIAGPWSRSGRLGSAASSRFTRIVNSLGALVIPILIIVSAVLARINVKAGRGDRLGARRLVIVNFAAIMTGWAFAASHFTNIGVEVTRVFLAIGSALFDSAVVWLSYLGLEPYIRRYRPGTILGSTKLLAGEWRDPRVGVDVMIGVAAGLAMTLLYAAHNVIPVIAGRLEPMPLFSAIDTLTGFRFTFAALATQFSSAITSGLLAAAGVVALVLLLRNTALGVAVAVVCFTPAVISGMFPGTTPTLDLVIGAGIISILILVVLRAGLLATAAAMFTHFILLRAPITADVGSWQATTGLWYVGVVLALGLGGCYLARFGKGDRV